MTAPGPNAPRCDPVDRSLATFSTAAKFGAELQESARFCPECGTRLDGGGTNQDQGSTFTAERHVFGLAPPEILVAIAVPQCLQAKHVAEHHVNAVRVLGRYRGPIRVAIAGGVFALGPIQFGRQAIPCFAA